MLSMMNQYTKPDFHNSIQCSVILTDYIRQYQTKFFRLSTLSMILLDLSITSKLEVRMISPLFRNFDFAFLFYGYEVWQSFHELILLT